MNHKEEKIKFSYRESGIIILAFGALYLISRYNYLLFHTLSEGFSIAIALAIFIFAWHSHRMMKNDFFTVIGVAYLFVGLLDLLHTLAYPGMSVLAGSSTDLGAQLWISARFMEAASLGIALFFLKRRTNRELIFTIYALVTALLITTVFTGFMPACFVEGQGLTPFKTTVEYLICFILAAAAFFLYKNREAIDHSVFILIFASLLVTALAEILFSFYSNPYDLANLSGHFLKIISFYLIYKAIIWVGFTTPFGLQFRELRQNEEKLRKALAEREAAQRKTKREQGKFLNILDSIKDGIYMVDSECNVVYVNPVIKREFGMVDEKKCYEYLNGLREQCPWCNMDKVMSGETVRWEWEVPETGKIYDIIESPVTDSDGSMLKLKILRDVTEMKHAEQQIRESEERYDLILDSVELGIWDWDLQKNTVVWNKQMYGLLGMTPHHGETDPDIFFERIHSEDRERIQQEVKSLLANGHFLDTELRVLTSEGETLWLKSKGKLYRNEEGEPVRLLGVNYDITAAREAEETIKSLSRFPEENANPVLRVSLDAKLMYANKAAAPLLEGWGIDVGEEVPSFINEQIESAFKQKSVESFDFQIGELHFTISCVPILQAKYANLYGMDITEKKIIEQREKEAAALATASKTALDAMQAMGEGIAVIQLDGTITSVNPALTRLIGYEANELLGWNIEEILPKLFKEYSLQTTSEAWMKLKQGQAPVNPPINIIPKSGTSKSVLPTVSFIRKENNEPIAVVLSLKDISPILKMQEELKQSEKLFRLLAETIEDVFWMRSTDFEEILYVSPAYEKIWGRSRESLYKAPHSLIDSVYPGDRDKLTSKMSRRLDEVQRLEYRIIRPDGEIRWIRDRTFPVTDENDEQIGTVGNSTDITDLIDIQNSLEKSKIMLDEAQRIAHLGNWEWDLITDEITWSDETYKILGFESGKARPAYDLFMKIVHPEDRNMVQQEIEKTLENNERYSIDHRIVKQNGEVRHVHEDGETMLNEEGKPVRMIGTVQDITERVRLERMLRTQDKLVSLGRITAGIAHEIRNPLMGMKIYMDILKRIHQEGRTAKPEEIEEIMGQLHGANKKIESVIKRVMDFAKPSTPRMQDTDINKAVREAVELSSVFLRKKGIKMTSEFESSSPRSQADSQMISQLVLNLLSNAAEALSKTEGKKQIRVSTKKLDGKIQITVSDSGPGIPENVRQHIFEPFFTTKKEGTGIGLSLCKRIVDDHRGSLFIEENEGGGTKFIAVLPMPDNVSADDKNSQ